MGVTRIVSLLGPLTLTLSMCFSKGRYLLHETLEPVASIHRWEMLAAEGEWSSEGQARCQGWSSKAGKRQWSGLGTDLSVTAGCGLAPHAVATHWSHLAWSVPSLCNSCLHCALVPGWRCSCFLPDPQEGPLCSGYGNQKCQTFHHPSMNCSCRV